MRVKVQEESYMNKKTVVKAIAVTALVGVVGYGGVQGISAYFTDTAEKTNTVTVGDVTTDLEEPGWDKTPDDEKNDITPNQKIPKDPKVTNTGTNDAYVFIEVQVPVKKIITVGSNGQKLPAANTELFQYKVNSGWVKVEDSEMTSDGAVTAHRYVYAYGTSTACKALKHGETTPALFDSITLINAIEGQIDNATLNMPVKSYAIQTENIGNSSAPADVYKIYVNQNQ